MHSSNNGKNSYQVTPPNDKPAPRGSCSKRTRICIFVLVVILLAGIIIGIVAAVLQASESMTADVPQGPAIGNSPTTASGAVVTTSSSSTMTTRTSAQPTTASVTTAVPSRTSFIGAFSIFQLKNPQFLNDLILPNTVYDEYIASVCRIINSTLVVVGFDSSCYDANVRLADYVVRFRVAVKVRANETVAQAQLTASASIVKAIAESTSYSALNADRTTVTFYNSYGLYAQLNNCISSCCGVNSFCSPTIEDSLCLCRPGYLLSSNGSCTACSNDAVQCPNSPNTCGVKCDNIRDCSDSSDEHNCTCTTSQYQCSSGSLYLCQDQTTWCDGKQNCADRSDEQSCNSPSIACPKESIGLCKASGRCLFPIHQCNWFQDCPDDFDETNCTCPSYGCPCQNGRCIYKRWLCDGNKDCPLGDDKNSTRCPCPSYGYQCQNSRCIYKSWLCDGNKDCPNGDDEKNCAQCTPSQFLCAATNTCINATAVCDGVSHCKDSADENQCFNLSDVSGPGFSNLLTAKFQNQSGFYVCADNWKTPAFSDKLCQMNGLNASSSSTILTNVSDVSARFVTVEINSNTSLLVPVRLQQCASRQGVQIICAAKSTTCGRKQMADVAVGYITNGQQAPIGSWPWQVQLFTADGFFFCGGSLISDRWVLTAAHCIQFGDGPNTIVRPDEIDVRMGSILTNDPKAIKQRVKLVIPHEDYRDTDPKVFFDIGLIQLVDRVNMSQKVQPICLPADSNIELNQFKVCFGTGFGKTSAAPDAALSPILLQTRMNILPPTACFSNTTTFRIFDRTSGRQLCVGTVPTQRERNAAKGDSGGPMSCLDQNDIWTVIGVTSYGEPGTYDFSIMTSVKMFVDWITMKMKNYP